MRDNNDPVEAVLTAFLEYFESGGDEPTLEHLSAADRERAERLLSLMRAGRGIDPYSSRPSVEHLLAGTQLEHLLTNTVGRATVPVANVAAAVRAHLEGYLPLPVVVLAEDANIEGVSSDVVVHVGAHRLRLQLRHDLNEPAELANLDPAASAGPIFGRFPDTAGVLLAFPDEAFSSLAVDAFDTVACIETPNGTLAGPATHRPVMPLLDTVRAFLEELAPSLDLTGEPGTDRTTVDPAAIGHRCAALAVASARTDGAKARIPAKKQTWTSLSDAHVGALAHLVSDAMVGLSRDQLAARVKGLSEVA